MCGFVGVSKIDMLGAVGKSKDLEERSKQEARVERVNKEELEYQSRLLWANIPKRYRDAEFKPKGKLQMKLAKAFVSNIERAGNKKLEGLSDMLIFGGVGVGKTYLSIAILKHIIKQGFYGKYITEYELLDLFFRKEYKVFDRFKEAPLLIVDEVAKPGLADWQKKQIEELISWRYNEMKPTFYITNATAEEFKEFVGDRAADRMRENNIIRVALSGESVRGKGLGD